MLQEARVLLLHQESMYGTSRVSLFCCFPFIYTVFNIPELKNRGYFLSPVLALFVISLLLVAMCGITWDLLHVTWMEGKQ